MIRCMSVLVLTALMAQAASAATPESDDFLPNIVIILADDLGYGDPGCYNDQSRIPTPNIDALAAEGVRFTDAHTPSSVCTPTRYGLMTGRFCWRTPLARSVLWPWDPPLIEADRLTLPQMLRSRGYATACIGKWHLGWDWPLEGGGYVTDEFSGHTIPRNQRDAFGARIDFSRATRGGPTDRGFDFYFGDDVPNFPPYCFIENQRTVGIPTVPKPDDMFGHAGPALAAWDLSLVLPTLAQRAAAYIESHGAAPTRQPFFLYLSLTAPHTPIAPSPHFTGKSQAGAYGDFVHEVDWVVGEVVDALSRTELASDTLLIFTSDNGSPQRDGTGMSGPVGSVKEYGYDPSRPWRGMKADAWEAGHRVPFIARWPGHTSAGGTCDEPIILTDLMRTIAGIIGHDLPDNAAEDSFDILPALAGADLDAPIHDVLVHHSSQGVFAIREGRWKLILGRGSGGFTRFTPAADAPPGQLYDLEQDPTESNNVYREHPDIVERLTERLRAMGALTTG